MRKEGSGYPPHLKKMRNLSLLSSCKLEKKRVQKWRQRLSLDLETTQCASAGEINEQRQVHVKRFCSTHSEALSGV